MGFITHPHNKHLSNPIHIIQGIIGGMQTMSYAKSFVTQLTHFYASIKNIWSPNTLNQGWTQEF